VWTTLAAVTVLAMGARVARAQSVTALRFPVGELRFSVGDLRFEVGDFEPGAIQPLAFRVEDLDATEVTDREVRFRLSADVLFDFDSADLRDEATGTLAGLAARTRAELPGSGVRVEGHTDAKGTTDYNRGLSERRAETVAAWLAEHGGISRERIVTLGLGETQPVAPNERPDGSDDPLARQRNRRVEIVVERQRQ
jgi:outer membrane protein OmpA-like peptidoglycan-associated protein